MVSSTATPDPHADPPAPPRVVAIGASAGGLVAIEEFLQHVPPKIGLAFLVVQHLDPTQKAMLPDLLQRVTDMPVHEAQSQMRLEAGHVYTIPPNAELSLADGRLRVETPDEPRGMRLPINVLFSSMAGARGDEAIAVVLSGMGSDGTLGMQAVKAVGGLAVVQQPDSAQFDSMPKSAIAAGCADIVAPPAELPGKILQYIALQPDADVALEGDGEPESDTDSLQHIFEMLLKATGHDFSLYKPRTLNRRIERRMVIHGISTVANYAQFLRENPNEVDLLFKELLIGVTSFFRDPVVWERLAMALPDLLARRRGEPMVRAWVIGCSTGEEAYSLAMLFEETVHRLPQFQGLSLQIFASDLSADGIVTARRGQYPASIRETVSPERLARFFTDHGAYFQINTKVRDKVMFAHHDLVLDPPFTKLDLITCRNLLIYFDSALQQRLFPLFHYCLRPGGLLLLGSAETVGKFGRLFAPLDAKLRLYQRNDEVSLSGPEVLVTSTPPLSKPTKEHSVPRPTERLHDNLQTAADQVLLQVHSPAAVVVNGAGDIVYISGRTGNYLEPAAGKANWNFHAMVRDGLREPLGEAIARAALQPEPLQLHGLQVHLPGAVHTVDVTVQALHEPAALNGMTMIVFRDLEPAPRRRRRRKSKGAGESPDDQAVQHYRDEIQALREESRASKEELQSANEELQSTNEELQSTNEELTTSKEEMQSMNEELQTINAELRSKLDDLALAQSDMQNLLNSIEIAILFLDQDLNVRRFTDRAAKIINLRETDVGRPLSDLTTVLQYPDLHHDALQTLRALEVSEKQILTDDGRWFSVRIMPYRTLDDRIDGVVITLLDITESKALESTLRHGSQE